MINIISSNATAASDALKKVDRGEGEDNLQWLARNMPAGNEQTTLVMVGGTSLTAFRLRVAQSHVRHDLAPSYWSHVMLLGKAAKNPASTTVTEISLEPPQGFAYPPPTNGLQKGKLGQYRDAAQFPNIAILSVPRAPQAVAEALDRFQKQRAVLDGVALIVRWLEYAWGVGRSSNPLVDSIGIPSAAMLEVAVGATGFDLTPGLESRSSCPEAIWQAAKWWHDYYKDQNRLPLTGAYYIGHSL
ncbi:MAG TPA: hypothetical protein VKA60_15275 [Blastocatellia bacterium]|nr:hypothetical protein [Blastocatellia bacterium]